MCLVDPMCNSSTYATIDATKYLQLKQVVCDPGAAS